MTNFGHNSNVKTKWIRINIRIMIFTSMIRYSYIVITIINIYNPRNNIKFTKYKKKSEKKNYPVLDFLKLKYHTKRKRRRKR